LAMAGSSSAATPATGLVNGHGHATPIGLVNNGVHINPNGRNQPTIFTSEPAQVLQLPSRGGVQQAQPTLMRRAMAGPTATERLFGGNSSEALSVDTSAAELSRLTIVTMRQLQRALQHKIMQNTRSSMDVWAAFNKLDRRKAKHLNLADFIAAVRGFNLVCSDELVAQLLHALDRDHDGVLSLTEFVNGLRPDNHHGASAVQLQEIPDYGISSRRHFRTIRFHHPLHNAFDAMEGLSDGAGQ